MAGRVTVSSGDTPVILTGLDATNSVSAFADDALSVAFQLPHTVAAWSAVTVYCDDAASITPTVTDPSGKSLSAVAAPCRAGRPIVLGPFRYAGTYTIS